MGFNEMELVNHWMRPTTKSSIELHCNCVINQKISWYIANVDTGTCKSAASMTPQEVIDTVLYPTADEALVPTEK